MTEKFSKICLLDYLLAAVTVALAGVWSLDLIAPFSSWFFRLAMMLMAMGIGALALTLGIRRTIREAQAAERYLDVVCRLDPNNYSGCVSFDSLPVLSNNNPWRMLCWRVKDCVESYSARLQKAEHDRARAEVRAHRLSSQREQVTEILASLQEPVVAVDQYDSLLLANPTAQRLFQLEQASTGERALGRLAECEKLIDLLNETRRHKALTNRTGEVEFVDSSGAKHWYGVNVRSIPLGPESSGSENNSPHGAVAIFRDISGQKVSQKRNAEFVAAVSHEMKTPLAGIKAYVELLAEGDAEDEETREDFLEVINGQADRLQRLIDNLLNLARIEAGVMNVSKQPCSLNEVLEEALHVVQPAAERKQITLVSDLSNMYLNAQVDRDMILQAAINLLSNAIKYTFDSGRVVLRSRMTDTEVEFEVEDTGVGLSPEDCTKVFEKFYRVKKDQQMASGTGLGLPLAKHIVEDVHGGRLTVESQLGKGSTFRITLPKPQ